MKFEPLGDRLLIEPIDDAVQKTAGGLFIPDTAQEKPLQGKVVAVGAGKKDSKGNAIPLSIKEGDTVLHGKYGGTEVELDGTKYMILSESEVLAKIVD